MDDDGVDERVQMLGSSFDEDDRHDSRTALLRSTAAGLRFRKRTAEPFTTIDWIGDINRDRLRRGRLREQKSSSWRSFVRYVFDASQSWILVALIGVVVGLIAGLIDIAVEWLSGLKNGICLPEFWLSKALCCRGLDPCENWRTWSGFIPNISTAGAFIFNLFMFFSVGLLLAVTCAYLVKVYAPFAAGSGIPEIKTILGGFVVTKYLGAWTLLMKSAGLVLSVASGLNLGKEGPSVHLACCVGNILSRIFEKFRLNEVKKREVLSASAAAGVSVAFGAPIGGVLFSLEARRAVLDYEASSYFPHKTMWRSFFCAVVAALTLQIMDPFHTGKLVLFQVSYRNSWYWFEMLPFILLGCAGGLLGALFIKLNIRMTAFRQRSRLAQYPITEVAVVAAVTLLASFGSDFLRLDTGILIGTLFAECDGSAPDSLGLCSSELVSRAIAGLLVACFVKLVLTVFTFGTRIPCGLFIPSLAVGACLGRAVGIIMQLFQQAHPDWGMFAECRAVTHCITPGIYALVGAASMLGGVTRMTVSLVVIVFELTGGINVILPLMVATMFTLRVHLWPVVATNGDRAFDPFLLRADSYEELIKLNGYPFLDGEDGADMAVARDIMHSQDIVSLTLHGNTFSSLETLCRTYHYRGFPVVTNRQDNIVVGFVSRQELLDRLEEKRKADDVTDDTPCHFSRELPLGEASASVSLHDLVDETPVQVVETTSLAQIAYMFKVLGLRYCLVVYHSRLVGIISKKDILRYRRLAEARISSRVYTRIPDTIAGDEM